VTAHHAVWPHSNGALSRGPLRINPLNDSLSEDHSIRDDRSGPEMAGCLRESEWPNAFAGFGPFPQESISECAP
jgi:hypothetical protein